MLHLLLILAVVQARNKSQNDTIRIQTPEHEQNVNNTKNIFYSCVITSSSYLTYNDEVVMNQLNSIIEAYQTIESPEVRYETQRKASKRIQIDATQYCILRQSGITAKQMYDEIQVGQFNVTQYYYLMNDFDLSKYQNQSAKITFDENEESVWRIMEDFQAKSREMMGDDEFDGLNYSQYPDYMENPYETQVFGQSIDKQSNISILIFASVFISFFVIMILAYNALKDSHKKVEQKKDKKSKKQK
ncbi:unnamed protein product [Paramecium primaurelia]|uniref:Transmembrane protein n=1 Tax=Paramecium primaurelia TaxID=5886 RepID=A0A8S1KZV6_PARPR|nr:unnamed protein product [Paramecium primaurelia]